MDIFHEPVEDLLFSCVLQRLNLCEWFFRVKRSVAQAKECILGAAAVHCCYNTHGYSPCCVLDGMFAPFNSLARKTNKSFESKRLDADNLILSSCKVGSRESSCYSRAIEP